MTELIALVTGASRGIGYAIAKRLAPHLSRLLITSCHEEHIENARRQLEKDSTVLISSYYHDHSRRDAPAAIANWARQQSQSIDLLVLNAGYYLEGALHSIAPGAFEKLFRVNFLANHHLVQHLLPLVRRSHLKRIVFIGSTDGYETDPVAPTYAVAKWALRAYALHLRQELISDRIGVTLISPGATLTDMWLAENPSPDRLLAPDDIAQLVTVLLTLSPQAVVEELICKPILGNVAI